jgi:hypothetical protein
MGTELTVEIVNTVVVGEGVAAIASTAFKIPAESTRPKETEEKKRLLFKGGPLEAA